MPFDHLCPRARVDLECARLEVDEGELVPDGVVHLRGDPAPFREHRLPLPGRPGLGVEPGARGLLLREPPPDRQVGAEQRGDDDLGDDAGRQLEQLDPALEPSRELARGAEVGRRVGPGGEQGEGGEHEDDGRGPVPPAQHERQDGDRQQRRAGEGDARDPEDR